MMVTSEHDRRRDTALADSPVHLKRYLYTALGISVENTGLRADDQLVLAGLADPVNIVRKLILNLLRSSLIYVLKHLGRYAVCLRQVLRLG